MIQAIRTPNEIGEILRIPTRAVYGLIKQGRIKSLRVGRKIRVLQGDLDDYISEQRKRGSA